MARAWQRASRRVALLVLGVIGPARAAAAPGCDDTDAACKAFPAPPVEPASQPPLPAAEPLPQPQQSAPAHHPYVTQGPGAASAERPADEAPSAWSITALALGWGGLPYVGLSGELGLSQHIGASLVLGTWYWTASDDRAPPILYSGYTHRVGTNAAVYPFGGLEGLRLGLEAAYAVSTNDAVHGPRVREESLGVGFAMFIGHKMIRKSGFTFVADVGMGSHLLLLLGIGWSG